MRLQRDFGRSTSLKCACFCVCWKVSLAWWMSQWLSSAGTWACWVFLSTVRLRWVLSRSSFTWCQCWSSSRLPRDTRSCPPDDELTPATGLRKWKTIDFVAVMVRLMAAQWLQVMQKSSYVHFPLRNFDSFSELPQTHYKVSIPLLLLHNASLTRTNLPEEIIRKHFFAYFVEELNMEEGSCWIDQNKKRAETLRLQWNISIFVPDRERVTEVTLSH